MLLRAQDYDAATLKRLLPGIEFETAIETIEVISEKTEDKQMYDQREKASAQSRTHGPTHDLLTVASQSVTHDAKGNMTLTPAVLRLGSAPLKIKWALEIKLIATDTETPVSPSDPVGTLVPF